MKTAAEKSNPASQSSANANRATEHSAPQADFADRRDGASVYGGLQDVIHAGPAGVAQRQQLRSVFGDPVQGQGAEARPRNHTGLPDALKTGVESLSGLSLDDVRVHYNSSKPKQFQALAYTQGSEIHVAPGQERHIPHEAWHVVQQKQGLVKPTMSINDMVINDSKNFEKEADEKGKMANASPRSWKERLRDKQNNPGLKEVFCSERFEFPMRLVLPVKEAAAMQSHYSAMQI